MATRVLNRERLKRKLAALPKRARAEIHKALEKGAEEIKTTARNLVPVSSGDLRESIDYTFGKFEADNPNVRGVQAGGGLEDPELSVTIHAGDEKAYYAAFVEFGTKPHEQGGLFAGAQHPGTKAQPYFFTAYRLLKKRVKSRIARATRKAARDVAAGGA